MLTYSPNEHDVSISSGHHQMTMTSVDPQDLKETWVCASSTTNKTAELVKSPSFTRCVRMFRGMSVWPLVTLRAPFWRWRVSPDVRSPSHSPVFPPPPTQNCFHQPSPLFSSSYYRFLQLLNLSCPQNCPLLHLCLYPKISPPKLFSYPLSLPSHAVILRYRHMT